MAEKTSLLGQTRPISHINSDSLFYSYRKNIANPPTLHLFSGDISVHKAAWMSLFLTFPLHYLVSVHNVDTLRTDYLKNRIFAACEPSDLRSAVPWRENACVRHRLTEFMDGHYLRKPYTNTIDTILFTYILEFWRLL